MTRRSILSPVGPLLPALLCAVLAAALMAEFLKPARIGEAPPAGAATGQTSPLPPPAVGAALPSLEAFAEIAERPLFSPTRRPLAEGPSEGPSVPAEVAAPPRPQDLEITIVGIVTGPRALILVRTDRGQLVPMAEGDDLHGWTLSKIEPLRAIFRRDADETAVPIEYRAN